MQRQGWQELFGDWSWVRGEGKFPIPAYSEFMPPPRIGQKPYGAIETAPPFMESDPYGLVISSRERDDELAVGLPLIGRELIEAMEHLVAGHKGRGIGHLHLCDNPYWPDMLAARIGARPHQPYLFLSPLAFSKTQDDKGRVRWTLFGSSDEGPEKGFWKSFFTAPDIELPADAALAALRSILQPIYSLSPLDFAALRESGFRILPSPADPDFPQWNDTKLPGWTRDLILRDAEPVASIRYLLTFAPFGLLPASIREAYLSGALELLPFPGSLVFWGSPLYRRLARELPRAMQIPLLQVVARHSGKGIRVPQAGWLHCPRPDHPTHNEGLGAERSTYRRSHRWERKHRDDPPTAAHEDHIYKVLFSTTPDDVGLYDKPMARNAQLWSSDFHLILDGPPADAKAIAQAHAGIEKGGSFGYRFQFPPMQAGAHSLFWHLPLIAYRDAASGEARVIGDTLHGYITASAEQAILPRIELWPRFVFPTAIPHSTENITDALDRTPLTFLHTATRDFEVEYWNTIAFLAEGRYLNKNSGDCVTDPATEKHLIHHQRDLDALGHHLLDHYERLFSGVPGALAGSQPFRWTTDFAFPWLGGWLGNQTGRKEERNIIAVIPGKNRGEAIIMADHYDTAYMEDLYGYGTNVQGDHSRVSAAGADDNHSATATLMLAAPIFLELSRAGKLACDIWLVHLTGEEFPSDCLGARNLTERLIETGLKLTLADGSTADLSQTRIRGLYVLDMIAHNNDRARDIFQIAPGADGRALWLAVQAKIANLLWNRETALWNAEPERAPLSRGQRRAEGNEPPAMARHLALQGQVRPHDHPASTLFNTDGQIFSDAGIPAVLFMENYDIERKGYHDSLDTLANIDLDYGSALAAIAIESVARAATETSPSV